MSDFNDCRRCEKTLVAYLPQVIVGDNCRECGSYAYSSEKPAFLYLIFNEQLAEYKIGFGKMGKSRDRLKKDVQAGWSVLALWHAVDEKKALSWEGAVFKRLKIMLNSANQEEDPMGEWVEGWSESIKATAISAVALKQEIDKVVKAGL